MTTRITANNASSSPHQHHKKREKPKTLVTLHKNSKFIHGLKLKATCVEALQRPDGRDQEVENQLVDESTLRKSSFTQKNLILDPKLADVLLVGASEYGEFLRQEEAEAERIKQKPNEPGGREEDIRASEEEEKAIGKYLIFGANDLTPQFLDIDDEEEEEESREFQCSKISSTDTEEKDASFERKSELFFI